jgi:dTDP-4-amino-4,6-dideoxygalactose transaminase
MNFDQPALLGGAPLRITPFADRVTMGEPEKMAAMRVLDSDCLSAFLGAPGKFFYGGPEVQTFEKMWQDRYGFARAISVNSWTAGLVTCVGALQLEPGDEMICPPYTMSASAACALFYGVIPVFADIEADTFCLDPKAVEAAITPRTRAIMVVHLFGYPAKMDELLVIARKHNLRIIEDAAQAPGVLYKGRPVGAIGDLGGFSLNFHKHIHTGEGGVIVTQDDNLAERCCLIRNHGENTSEKREGADLHNLVGSNYRLTEIQAAIGQEQLKRLDGYLDHRVKLAAHLRHRLRQIPGLTPQEPPSDEGSTHANYVYPIRYNAEAAGLPRNLFVRAVNAEFAPPESVESTALTEGYVRPLYLNKVYQQRTFIGGFPFNLQDPPREYRAGLCPVTERLYEHEMLLTPLVREPLETKDMDDLANAIEKVLANKSALLDKFGSESGGIFTPVGAANSSNAAS